MPLHQAGFHQKLQMARHARLRLPEDGHDLADRQFRFGQQGEQAQPRAFAGSFECRQGLVENQGAPFIATNVRYRYKDIFMRVWWRWQAGSCGRVICARDRMALHDFNSLRSGDGSRSSIPPEAALFGKASIPLGRAIAKNNTTSVAAFSRH